MSPLLHQRRFFCLLIAFVLATGSSVTRSLAGQDTLPPSLSDICSTMQDPVSPDMPYHGTCQHDCCPQVPFLALPSANMPTAVTAWHLVSEVTVPHMARSHASSVITPPARAPPA